MGMPRLVLTEDSQGSILATSSVYACHRHMANKGDSDWRIPLWIQMICPGMLFFLIKFYPESPRWSDIFLFLPVALIADSSTGLWPKTDTRKPKGLWPRTKPTAIWITP